MFIKSRIGWQALTKKEYLETGDYYLITGTDIDEDKHIVDFNCCYYVSKERYEMDGKIQVYEGDIIVTKDGTIGKVAMVTGLDKPATLNSHLFVLRDLSGKLYNRFLLQVLVSHIFGDFVESTKTGSTLTGLPQKTFVEFRFLMPEMDEQMKIAQYLDNLDNLITLHQRKYNKLLNVKKSMLEKMFPKNGSNIPEIRFKGFTDPWEQRKLGNVANYRRGSFPQPYGKSEWYDGDGAMPFVQVADVSDEMNLVENTKQKISMLAQPMSVFAGKNTVLVTLQGSIGRVAITQYGAFVDRTVLIFEKYKEKIDTTFWAYIVKQKFIDEARKAPGGTIKTITKEALSDFDLSIPNYKEQQQIGTFFKQLDNLITLHQRELEKLQNIKKSMLEKMFV